MKILMVFLGGGLGSVLRYIISVFLINRFDVKSLYSTLSVNVIGSFLLGLLVSHIAKQQSPNESLALLLTVGFCGGFTTFSTFSLDSLNLLKDGLFLQAIIYIFGSFITSLVAVYIGYQLATS